MLVFTLFFGHLAKLLPTASLIPSLFCRAGSVDVFRVRPVDDHQRVVDNHASSPKFIFRASSFSISAALSGPSYSRDFAIGFGVLAIFTVATHPPNFGGAVLPALLALAVFTALAWDCGCRR